jgi:SAM-dependent methyltransferase
MVNLKNNLERVLQSLVSFIRKRKKQRMDVKVGEEKVWKSEKTHLEKLFYDHCGRPVRKYIYGKLGRLGAAKSIWEFGSSTGFNLFLIEKNYNQFTNIMGFDIDSVAVDLGNEIAEKNQSKVKLKSIDTLKEIDEFEDDCVDVVLSQGFLVTMTDEEIKRLLGNFIRMARVGVMLVERNTFNDYDIITARDDINTFDFESYLTNNLKVENRFSIEKIPSMRLLNTDIDINSIIFIHCNPEYFEPQFSLIYRQDFTN